MSNPLNIELYVKQSDLVIGAVLIPGAKAPRLVTEDMIKQMKNGSVIIDIAIDQGGIFETTDKITTHDDPHILSMVWFIMQLQICQVQYRVLRR